MNYAVYYTGATNGNPAGYVWNSVQIADDGAWTPPAGSAIVADPDYDLPIGTIYAPSTAYSLVGCPSATAGQPAILLLKPDQAGSASAVTVTLSDASAGGTFAPASVTFPSEINAVQTVTYTPKSAGDVTISATNSGSLANPAGLAITVANAEAAA